MIDQRKRIFAASQWITDLALTTASFFLAYRFRLLFEVEGHTLMSFRIYLWILAIILPTWAILLPAFQVYSEPTLPPWRPRLPAELAVPDNLEGPFKWFVFRPSQESISPKERTTHQSLAQAAADTSEKAHILNDSSAPYVPGSA